MMTKVWEENGNARVYWRATKRSVRAWHIQARGLSWRAAVETRPYGYGKVCALLHTIVSYRFLINYFTVHPDADFECLAVLMDHTHDVKSVAWHPSREILASASYDDTIKLYIDDPDDDWYCFSTLTGHTSTVWSVAFSPDGLYLASGSEDCSVRIWKEVKENEWVCVLVLEGHERSVYSVSWGPGSSPVDSSSLGWIASTGGDGKINIWELTVSASFLSPIPFDKVCLYHRSRHPMPPPRPP